MLEYAACKFRMNFLHDTIQASSLPNASRIVKDFVQT